MVASRFWIDEKLRMQAADKTASSAITIHFFEMTAKKNKAAADPNHAPREKVKINAKIWPAHENRLKARQRPRMIEAMITPTGILIAKT